MHKKVCLDAGHGGRDPGAVGGQGLKEKDVNLLVTLLVQRLLTPYVDVVLTRSEDVAVVPGGNTSTELTGRVTIANNAKVDLFVSIHCNSATDPAANGIEVFCFRLGSDSERIARALQRRLVAITGLRDRGVKTANFAVLRQTNMPAALIELPFISNPSEERLLASADFQDRCATAIAVGILEFLGVQNTIGLNPPQPSPSPAPPGLSPYRDIAGRWSEADILFMHKLGLMVGDQAGNFNPTGTVTREQQAAFLTRLLTLLRSAGVPGVEQIFQSAGR